ncbi:MAG: right-handed parallel beta-helix repeat-containing protein, partial [Actinobacteria bacterium]|nr:right-handed parallel beta-helix repeat-containing protein [Actinomycetota bacterium]
MPNIQTGTRVRAILVVVFVGIFSGALAQGFWMAARVPPAYYLSPSGNDAAAGTSPATAWRSLARASAAYLRPGQRLLLQGGSRFTGQLKIGALDGGNARRPVLITSYGHGRATIAPHGESGVVVSDTSGVDISNLVISGHATLRSSTSGIVLFSTLSSGPAFHSITISGVDVSGFGTGIHIFPEHFVGFRDVSIRDSVLHGNLDAGLATNGPPLNPAAPAYANENLRITGVVSYGNRGDPNDTTTDSGSGIVLGSVKNATVAWSTAHDNGGRGGATRQGPVGMFAYDAANVVIEHSLA